MNGYEIIVIIIKIEGGKNITLHVRDQNWATAHKRLTF